MKLKVNYFVDVAMLIGFFACAVTGVLKLPELNVAMSDGLYMTITTIHDWSGVASLAMAAVHVLLHMKWFANATKTIFLPGKARAMAKKSRPHISKSAVAIIAVLMLVPLGLFAYGRSPYTPTVPKGISYTAGSLKDGSYAGTATGYMPDLTVLVTVKNGSIKSVEIGSNNETPRWFARVETVIPNSIVKAQSTDVDTVSGATCSSEGILSAVENALEKAKK